MWQVGALVGQLRLNLTQWRTAVRTAHGNIMTLRTSLGGLSISTNKAGMAFTGFGARLRQFGGIAGPAAAIIGTLAPLGVIKSFRDAGKSVQEFHAIFKQMLGSVEEGEKLFESMFQFAMKSPFEYEEIMHGAAQLSTVMKGGREQIEAWMPIIGDITAMGKVMGIEYERSITQIIRMLSAGAAAGRSFRYKGISQALGFEAGKAYTPKETAEQIIKAWFDTTGKYHIRGFSEKYAMLEAGLISMLKDKWFLYRLEVLDTTSAYNDYVNILKIANKWLDDHLKRIIQFSAEHARAILAIGALTIALLGLRILAPVGAWIFAPIISGMELVIIKIPYLVGQLALLAIGFHTTGNAAMVAWAKTALPVIALVGSIMGLVAAVYTLKAVWSQNLWHIQQLWGDIKSAVASFFTFLADKAKAVLNFVLAIFEKTFGAIFNLLTAGFNLVIEAGATAADVIKNVLSGHPLKAIERLKTSSGRNWAAELLGLEFDAVKQGIKDLFRIDWSVVKQDFQHVVDVFANGRDELKDLFSQDFFMDMLDVFMTQFSGDVGKVKNELGKIFDGAYKDFNDFVDKALAGGTNIQFEGRMKEIHDAYEMLIKLSAEGKLSFEQMMQRPEFQTLLKGLGGGGEDKAAAKAAAKTAKELERLRESGEKLYQSLDPVRDSVSSFAQSLTELTAAGRVSDMTMMELGRKVGDQLKNAQPEVAFQIANAYKAMGKEAAIAAKEIERLTRQRLSQERYDAAKAVMDKIRPEGQQAFRQIYNDMNALNQQGIAISGDVYNFMSAYYWKTYGSMGKEALWELLQRMWDLGGVAGELATDIAEKWMLEDSKDDLDDMKSKFEGLGSEILNVGEKLTSVADKIGSKLGKKLGAVVSSIGGVLDGIETMSESIKKMTTAAAGGDGGKKGGSIGSVVNGIAGIASGALGAVSAVMSLCEAFGLLGEKAPKELKGIDKVMDEIKNSMDDWADQLTDTFVEFVKTGKFAFDEFANSVMEDLLKISMRYLIVQPIFDALGGAFAKGAIFSGGNVVPFARGGVVSRPTIFPMAKGRVGLMGERGPEAVVPLRRTADGKLGVSGTGGVVVNINDYRSNQSAPIEVNESKGLNGERVLTVTVRDAVKSMMARGEFDRDLLMNYGLRRNPA